jgi:hypothetical protein
MLTVSLNDLKTYSAKDLPDTVSLTYFGKHIASLVPCTTPLTRTSRSLMFTLLQITPFSDIPNLKGVTITVRDKPRWTLC